MQAIRKVVGDPLGLELYELWKEYEELKTTEAIYCKDIDKFEMVVQAFEYEKEHLKARDEAGSGLKRAPKRASEGILMHFERSITCIT